MLNEKRTSLEETLISAILIKGSAHGVDLFPQDFKNAKLGQIFQAAVEVEKQGQPIDPITIMSFLPDGKGIGAYISKIINLLPTSHNLPSYLENLKREIYKEKAVRLRQEIATKVVNENNSEEILRELVGSLDELQKRYLPRKNQNKFQETCLKLLEIIEEAKPRKDVLKFGIPEIDGLLFGAAPGEITIIAARPSVGKTALALQMSKNLAFQDMKSLMFSLEMQGLPVANRMLAGLSGCNTKLALRAPDTIHAELRSKMLDASSSLLKISEFVVIHDEPGQTITTICRDARREVRENGIKLLILDHIQHCKGYFKQPRRVQVEGIAQDFQDLCKELNVHGIILSQMGRGIEGENRPPRMSDLKESGAIEQVADNIIFIHRPNGAEETNGYRVELYMPKGRNVGSGIGSTFFNKDTQSFGSSRG